jgi:hypothetical protein
VALILHIADLHLVAPSASVPLSDHKSSLVSVADRVTHHDALKLTLQRLGEYLTRNSLNLHAVVVTGDVADKNNDGGYQAFKDLMEAIGSAKPPNNRIVLLPGNHDVSAGLRPEDLKRYDKFIRFIRSAGYVTPWLSGTDKVRTSEAEAHKYLVSLDVRSSCSLRASGAFISVSFRMANCRVVPRSSPPSIPLIMCDRVALVQFDMFPDTSEFRIGGTANGTFHKERIAENSDAENATNATRS